MDKEEVDVLMYEWKERLGLHDWTINWQFLRGRKKDESPDALDTHENSFGIFEGMDEEHKIIFIKLSPHHKNIGEVEHTIIHELLHALFFIIRYPYTKVFDYMLNAYTRKRPFTEGTRDERGYFWDIETRQALPFVIALDKLTEQDALNIEHPLVSHIANMLLSMKQREVQFMKKEDKKEKINQEEMETMLKEEMEDIE